MVEGKETNSKFQLVNIHPCFVKFLVKEVRECSYFSSDIIFMWTVTRYLFEVRRGLLG